MALVGTCSIETGVISFGFFVVVVVVDDSTPFLFFSSSVVVVIVVICIERKECCLIVYVCYDDAFIMDEGTMPHKFLLSVVVLVVNNSCID